MTRKQIILGAHFPGVNNMTVWSDPRAGSQIDFESFKRFTQAAERGKLDFVFLAEGLRLREQRGRLHDLDVVGRPNTLVVLAALAAVTSRIGLAGTLNATYNEPYNLARQLATLDHLSAGRSAWNVVTSPGAFTGENFRRGGYLPFDQRYERAQEFVSLARQLWNGGRHDVDYQGAQFDLRGRYDVPAPPQGHPVIFQAGDSSAGREFAASSADAIFTRHGALEEGQAFYADVKRRLQRYGRAPAELKILPGVGVVLGDTAEEAALRYAEVRRQQVSPRTAIVLLEQVWNRDLSSYDPEGPLPDSDPDLEGSVVAKGRTRQHDDNVATARRWREIAQREGLGIRDLIIRVTGRQQFVGTPAQVADDINRYVQADAADGFIIAPHLIPSGIEAFVDRVVPLLQEKGVFRRDYTGLTLREHLGLPPAQRHLAAPAEAVAS
ncbi:LLM class flavin-dependent oxidoreductase [Bordetella sp. LUAb4]|uniref:LLM class flavin-dependent oxidoreductase n=1 Tax=Bordetella sp. LUAb4 TaxID=2843195 RepID=UPI001E284CFD|nr:LLM class flavin-dependent oxidoreductase [Bordetella sp. LUAb4]